MTTESLQERYAAKSICFGCGPANEHGLRIRSVATGEAPTDPLVAEFDPSSWHAAFPGVLNGGIIGSLLDCHSNWAASYAIMKTTGAAAPPCTVTSDFHVTLKRPTPMSRVRIEARALVVDGDRVTTEATMTSLATGKITATCTGTFVAVKEGHPAFHRW